MLFEPPISDAETLASMLDLLEAGVAEESEVIEWIDARFGQTAAIVVIDMCGFSRTTREHGIVEFLRRMHEVQKIIIPIIRGEAGTVLNTLADSLACLFPTVDAAIVASMSMVHALDEHNDAHPDRAPQYLSIGIGYGRILVIDKRDAFGDQMNRAGKLGEDLAGRREILLTPAALATVKHLIKTEPRVIEFGGTELEVGVVDMGRANG